ncbi:hypothetical protein LWI28_000445 [Acer negundo]|uniref:Nucleotide-diphospho-sugar transferase domain-containing protein n=1 Tax=Acer negundo TaxID=4023 RepID=A0AAD5IWM6_ACENE|nr:hypothetical protein LWI28_000445 [Acer negundo]
MTGRRGRQSKSLHRSRIPVAIAVRIFLGCFFAFFFPYSFLSPTKPPRTTAKSTPLQVVSTICKSSEQLNQLKSQLVAVMEKNLELKIQASELTEKLRLAEQGKDHARKRVLVLGAQQKVGPFGTVKGSRTNPTVVPDESVNPRLDKVLERVAVGREVIVALVNSNVKDTLEVWFNSIKRLGIHNYLVVALDEEIFKFCVSNDVPVYKRDPDEGIDSTARTGGNHAVSGLKFRILRDFLQLGYSVLL